MRIATGEGTVPAVTEADAQALLEQWRFGEPQREFLQQAIVAADEIRGGPSATATLLPSAVATPEREHNPADPKCSCGHCPAQAAEETPGEATASVCWHDLIATAASDEMADIEKARQARQLVAELIQKEANELVAGEPETWDLKGLVEALAAIESFIATETYGMISEMLEGDDAPVAAASDDVSTHLKVNCPACGKKIRLRIQNTKVSTRASAAEEGIVPDNATLDPTRPATAKVILPAEVVAALSAFETAATTMLTALTGLRSLSVAADGSDLGTSSSSGQAAETSSAEAEANPATEGATATETETEAETAADPMETLKKQAADETPDAVTADATADVSEAAATDAPATDTGEAAMTLVMHDNGDPQVPPTVHTTPPPPPPHPDDENDPADKKDDTDNNDDAAPGDSETSYKHEDVHREDRRLYKQGRAAKDDAPFDIETATHDDLLAAVSSVLTERLGSGRRGLSLATKEGRDEWMADLERNTLRNQPMIAAANLGQIGPVYGTKAVDPSKVKGNVAVADASGVLPEGDNNSLVGIFSR